MKKVFFIVKSFVLFLLRIVLIYIDGGETCVICGNRSSYLPLCSKCRKLRFDINKIIDVPRCSVCGRELISTKELCFPCKSDNVKRHSDFCYALFSYRLWNKELMFMWKQQGVRTLSVFFASLVSDFFKKKDIEYVVPVPPRPGKINEKGWDQIEELCKNLEFIFGFKILRILKRNSSDQQKKLDRESRLKTIGKAYSLKSKSEIAKEVKKIKVSVPKKVCVLDDVSTTGATLESCSALVKEVFGCEVVGVALFIVD